MGTKKWTTLIKLILHIYLFSSIQQMKKITRGVANQRFPTNIATTKDEQNMGGEDTTPEQSPVTGSTRKRKRQDPV